ncbi:MAG TPA: hypothetical protein VGG63_18165 [Steroidobacteraceae bacterium]
MTGLAACFAALLFCGPAIAAGARASVEQKQLPYAPPPLLGFGNVLCAPVFACAPTSDPEVAASSGQRMLLYQQTRPQKETAFNPADFDRFQGYYEFDFPDGHVFVRLYRSANRYYWQVETAGQPPTEIFPESPTEFFATEFAAQLSFTTAADGRGSEMTLHELGVLHTAHRVSQTAYDAWLADLQRRISDDKPNPEADAALRRQLDAWDQEAKANPSERTPVAPVAPMVRTIAALGTLGEVRFVKVGPHGWEVYQASFANGELRCFMAPLSAAGKVNALDCQKVLAPGR